MRSLVMTLIGPDQPGLVDALARVIAAQGANWLDSRMAHLGGQFAGILRVETDAADVEPLLEALQAFDQIKVTVNVDPEAAAVAATPGTCITLDLVGNDRPGIVAEISQVFSELAVNVETIHTECKTAPMSGGKLFEAHATLQLPAGVETRDLRERLEAIAADLMVDISLSE